VLHQRPEHAGFISDTPVLSERNESNPLIIAEAVSTLNPEPMADFFRPFILGDGEEVIVEFIDVFRSWKRGGGRKIDFLKEAVKIEGVYVPSFYRPENNPDGTLKDFIPLMAGEPQRN